MPGKQPNCLRRFASLLACFAPASAAQAQLQGDRLFPPAVSVGTTCEVVAEGQFPTWPPQFESDRSDIRIEPMEVNGRLQISSDADVPHGLAWIRIFDPQSASQLLPLLLEPIATQTEREPNNELVSAQKIELPCSISGRLEKNGDIDVYRVAVTRGKPLSATIIANQVLGAPMDAILQITDARGNVLAQNDDSRGLDPQLNFTSSTDDVLFLRVFAFPQVPNSTIGFAGGKDYTYVLRLSEEPVLDHCLPLIAPSEPEIDFQAFDSSGLDLPTPSEKATSAVELRTQLATVLPATFISPRVVMRPGTPGWQWIPDYAEPAVCTLDSLAPDSSIRPPAVFSGHIANPGEVDSFRIETVKDRKYRAEMYSQRFGFGLDSVLRIFDPSSQQEIATNDDLARNQYDAAVEFTSPKDGPIEIQVSDLVHSGGPQHAYSMIVSSVKPRVELRVSADRFTVEAGQTIDIEIAVSRMNGFASRLQFEIAPTDSERPLHGITNTVVFSEPKGESAKSIKLQLHASDDSPNAHHRFKILAKEVSASPTADSGNTISETAYSASFEVRPNVFMQRLWLTTKAKK